MGNRPSWCTLRTNVNLASPWLSLVGLTVTVTAMGADFCAGMTHISQHILVARYVLSSGNKS